MTDSLDWNGIRYFLAIARAGQLSAAARRLGVDIATVSRRLALLEASMGARLFERSPNGYALSADGQSMLRLAETMESAILQVQTSVPSQAGAVCGRVRISAPDDFGSYFLAPLTAELCRQRPDLQPEILLSLQPHSLSRREADIAIALERPREGRLFSRRLCDYGLGLYASGAYLHGHPPIRDVDDLQDHVCIGDAEPAPRRKNAGMAASLTPRIRCTGLAAQVNAVLAGGGPCLLPHFVARQQAGLHAVLPDQVVLVRSLWLLVHADLRHDPRIIATQDFIVAQVRAARRILLPGPAPSPAVPSLSALGGALLAGQHGIA